MKYPPIFAFSLLASSLATLQAAALAPMRATEPPSVIAATLIAKNQDALVEIQATLSIKVEVIEGPPGIASALNQQPEHDQPGKTQGVVIHSSGLVVAPLALLDPGAIMGDETEIETPLGKIRLGVKATVSALKVITGDGHEYPAEILLRDPAAGLVLLKLTTPPEGSMTAVALTKDLPAPPPFSQVFDLERLSADFGRTPAVRMLRVVQTTPPPGPLFEVTGSAGAPGSAAFDAAGNFLGLTVLPLRNKGGGAVKSQPQICILPIAEILRLAAKALP